jgi:hypothetical protein
MAKDREPCDAIRPLLVELCDGDLPEAQREKVETHLGHCGDCRAVGVALRQSLMLAQEAWREAQTKPPTWYQRPALRFAAAVAIAASLLLGVGLMLRIAQSQSSNPPPMIGPVAHVLPVPPTTGRGGSGIEVSAADVSRLLEREETAARLARSAIILARYPEGRCAAVAEMHQISMAYPDTAAGQALRRTKAPAKGATP